MRKPLRLVNLFLSLVAALIGVALAKAWVSPAPSILSQSTTKPSQEGEALAYSPMARPPLTQFDVLLEKNPFKQPPPGPPGRPGPPPPPPIPPPSLVGTILVDHERKAILSDRGKANIYTVGQEVAGGLIVDIKEDRIIFKRGDVTQEIILKAAITPASATAVPPSTSVSGLPVEPTGQAVVPAPLPVGDQQDAADRREEVRRRREERKERLRQLMEQRKAAQ